MCTQLTKKGMPEVTSLTVLHDSWEGFGVSAQASTSVRHLALPCHWSQRAIVAADLVRCYGALGRSIIFCETKRDCNDLAAVLGDAMRARALHGDIPQSQREVRAPPRLIRLPCGRLCSIGQAY